MPDSHKKDSRHLNAITDAEQLESPISTAFKLARTFGTLDTAVNMVGERGKANLAKLDIKLY